MWDHQNPFQAQALPNKCLGKVYFHFQLYKTTYHGSRAPDQHHGGLGRMGEGKNGLTDPNIAMHSRDLKETNSTYWF